MQKEHADLAPLSLAPSTKTRDYIQFLEQNARSLGAENLYSTSAEVVSIRRVEGLGYGLFAEKDFKPGEVIFYLDLEPSEESDVVDLDESYTEPYQSYCFSLVGAGQYYFPALTSILATNHSCEPNAGFQSFGKPIIREVATGGRTKTTVSVPFVAHTEIQKGSQITLDYASFTTSNDGHDGGTWSLDCGCDSKENCRHQARSFCSESPELQEQLFRNKQVLAHIVAEPANDKFLKRMKVKYPELYAEFLETLNIQTDIAQHFIQLRTFLMDELLETT